MKAMIKGMALAAAFALIASCANPVGGGSGGSGGGGDSIDPNNPNAIIAAIPERNVQLPASLQEQSGTSGSAIGASSYTAETFSDFGAQPGVKANGWYNVTDAATTPNMAQFFIQLIKAVGERDQISFGVPHDIGVMAFPAGLTGPNNETAMDIGVLRIDKVSESKFDVFWTVPYSGVDENGDPMVGTYYINLSLELTSAGMAAELLLMLEPQGQSRFLQDYASYDPSTGKSVTYWYDPWGGDSFRQIYQEDGGTIRFGELWEQGAERSKSVAWANDNYGGIAWSSDESDGVFAGTEIYDSNGYLVMESWGPESLADQNAWLVQEDTAYSANTIDLSTDYSDGAPETIEVRHNHGDNSFEVLVDGTPDAGLAAEFKTAHDAGDHIWRWTWNPNTWGSGSVLYYSSSWNYDGGTNTSSNIYTPGYVVPQATTFLGTTTYQENRFPLRYVQADRTGYTLQRIQTGEPETYTVTWEEDDQMVSRDFTWTPYEWWLENDAVTTDSVGECNPDAGDISVTNINENEYWVWDTTEDKVVKSKLLMLSSSKADPDNFSPTPEAQGVIDAVRSNIETVAGQVEQELESLSVPTSSLPPASQFPAAN